MSGKLPAYNVWQGALAPPVTANTHHHTTNDVEKTQEG